MAFRELVIVLGTPQRASLQMLYAFEFLDGIGPQSQASGVILLFRW